MHPDYLQYKRPGDLISAAEWNALVDSAREKFISLSGSRTDQFIGEFDTERLLAAFQRAFSGIDVPAFSVFVLHIEDTGERATYPGPPEYWFDGITYKQDYVYLTNGANTFGTGTETEGGDETGYSGYGRAIGDYEPTRVRVADVDDNHTLPFAGQWCGPLPDEYSVCLEGCGLMCVEMEDPQSDGSRFCWVTAPRKTPVWLVKTTTVTPPDTLKDVDVWYGPPGSEEVSSTPKITFKAIFKGSTSLQANTFCLAIYLQCNRYLIPLEAGGDDTIVTVKSASQNSLGICLWDGVIATPDPTPTSYCGDIFADGQPCYLSILNGTSGQVLTVGAHYQGVYIGSRLVDPSTDLKYPVYAIKEYQSLYYFELTSELKYGVTASSPNAKLLTYNTSTSDYDSGDAIRVKDPTLTLFSGKSSDAYQRGYRGYARKQDEHYEIINMEKAARWVRVHNRVITELIDGRDIDPNNVGITIDDDLKWYYVGSDNTQDGFCVYDPGKQTGSGRYVYVIANSISGAGIYTCTLALPIGSPRDGDISDYWGTQHDTISPYGGGSWEHQTIRNSLYPQVLPGATGIGIFDRVGSGDLSTGGQPNYRTIVSDQRALIVWMTLDADLNFTDATGVINALLPWTFFPFSSVDATFPQTINNPFHATGLAGDQLVGIWDNTASRYTAIASSRGPGLIYKATLTGTLNESVTIVGVNDIHPYGGGIDIPGPRNAFNLFNLAGNIGDIVLVLRKDNSSIPFDIIQVIHHKNTITDDVTYVGGVLKKVRHDYQMMSDGPANVPETLFTATQSKFVYDVSLVGNTEQYLYSYGWIIDLTAGGSLPVWTGSYMSFIGFISVDMGGVAVSMDTGLIINGTEGGLEQIFATTPSDVLTGVTIVDPATFVFSRATEWVWGNTPLYDRTVSLSTVQIVTVNSVSFDGSKEYYTYQQIRVFEAGVQANQDIWIGSTCPTTLSLGGGGLVVEDDEGYKLPPLLEAPAEAPVEAPVEILPSESKSSLEILIQSLVDRVSSLEEEIKYLKDKDKDKNKDG